MQRTCGSVASSVSFCQYLQCVQEQNNSSKASISRHTRETISLQYINLALVLCRRVKGDQGREQAHTSKSGPEFAPKSSIPEMCAPPSSPLRRPILLTEYTIERFRWGDKYYLLLRWHNHQSQCYTVRGHAPGRGFWGLPKIFANKGRFGRSKMFSRTSRNSKTFRFISYVSLAIAESRDVPSWFTSFACDLQKTEKGNGQKKKNSLSRFIINNPVYGRRVNSFVLVCSLSSHRHLFIPLIFGSRFDS
jgi:hypothetical protein